MRKQKEKISRKAIIHSSLGEFTKNGKPYRGGHGEENIRELKKRGIDYNVVEQYPNGVRLGNIPSHEQSWRRHGSMHTWFPKTWTRRTIKRAGEKVINSVPYKLPDHMYLFGTHRKVKVAVVRHKGRPATIFPYYKQSGGKR